MSLDPKDMDWKAAERQAKDLLQREERGELTENERTELNAIAESKGQPLHDFLWCMCNIVSECAKQRCPAADVSHMPKNSDHPKKEPDGLEAETLVEIEAMRKAAVKCGLTLHDYMLHCLLHKGGVPGQPPGAVATDGTTPVNVKKRPYNKWPQLTNPRKIAAVKAWLDYSTYAKERGTGQPTFKDCFDEIEDKLRTLGVTSPKHLQSIVKSRHEAKRVAIEKESAAKRQEKRMKDPLTD